MLKRAPTRGTAWQPVQVRKVSQGLKGKGKAWHCQVAKIPSVPYQALWQHLPQN